jgi:hypothetical protein
MRLIAGICGLAALALAQNAAAVTLTPVSFSPEFEVKLNEELGAREGEYLTGVVQESVQNELAREGVQLGSGGGTIEIVIVDADPNRPTMQQLRDTPGLDPIRSFSIGGASLRAVVRGANGEVLTEVEHSRYNHNIDEFAGLPTQWMEARSSIRGFARRLADAYVAHSGR